MNTYFRSERFILLASKEVGVGGTIYFLLFGGGIASLCAGPVSLRRVVAIIVGRRVQSVEKVVCTYVCMSNTMWNCFGES